MTNITMQEAAKEIRKIAKDNGMTFKKQQKQNNELVLYHFVNRSTHAVVLDGCTFWNAYENCMNGFISANNQN